MCFELLLGECLSCPSSKHTLSVSGHERGTRYFVDKESQKQRSRGKKKKGKKKVKAQSPQTKRNHAVCPSVTEQHPGRLGLAVSSAVFLSLLRRGSLPPSKRSTSEKAGRAAAGPSGRGSRPRARAAPSSSRGAGQGRVQAAGRCAPRAVEVAAPRRALSPRWITGPGRRRKETCPGGGGGGPERAREESSLLLRCQRAAAAAGADEGAPSERGAHLGAARGGPREAGY